MEEYTYSISERKRRLQHKVFASAVLLLGIFISFQIESRLFALLWLAVSLCSGLVLFFERKFPNGNWEIKLNQEGLSISWPNGSINYPLSKIKGFHQAKIEGTENSTTYNYFLIDNYALRFDPPLSSKAKYFKEVLRHYSIPISQINDYDRQEDYENFMWRTRRPVKSLLNDVILGDKNKD